MSRILIVDDDLQARAMLRQMLELNGYDIVEAVNGNDAIKIYQNNPTDLIITDLIMPEKEGIETIRELRRDFPDVKIIAISGGGRIGPDAYLTLAKKLGASYTLEKPFRQKEILDAIINIMNSCHI
jgi:CheY-like chemotaxis protein